MIPVEEVEPPLQQKKQKMSSLFHHHHQPCLSFSSLPDEIALNCFARLSKFYYPKLSLVSKTFRSLISSPDLCAARCQTGTTEICLYICLKFSTALFTEPTRRWFSLRVTPFRYLIDGRDLEGSTGNRLLPFSKSAPYSTSTVTIGSEIYSFGGPMDDNFEHSSAVRVYDCRSNTWRDLPNMKMERTRASACVLDDKIYVMGGCRAWFEEHSWFEIFDIKTQTWKTLPANPERNVRLGDTVCKISAVEGKIYVKTDMELEDWVYDVKESKWSVADGHLSARWSNSWCVIDNIMYSYSSSRYVWYDLEGKKWRDVKGLEAFRKYRSFRTGYRNCMVELVNYGGKLAILWDRFEMPGRSQKKNIWCAVVAVRRWHGAVVMENIEWVDVVLKVPKSYEFLRCQAISV